MSARRSTASSGLESDQSERSSARGGSPRIGGRSAGRYSQNPCSSICPWYHATQSAQRFVPGVPPSTNREYQRSLPHGLNDHHVRLEPRLPGP
eukprot:1146390-Rhodomonas_salina.1